MVGMPEVEQLNGQEGLINIHRLDKEIDKSTLIKLVKGSPMFRLL